MSPRTAERAEAARHVAVRKNQRRHDRIRQRQPRRAPSDRGLLITSVAAKTLDGPGAQILTARPIGLEELLPELGLKGGGRARVDGGGETSVRSMFRNPEPIDFTVDEEASNLRELAF